MTVRSMLWTLLALSACEPLPDDTGDTGDTGTPSGACPQGLSEVDGIAVNVRTHSFNTLNVQLSFDQDATWEGQSAACASDDRLRVRVLLLLAGEPYAWLDSDAPDLGSFTPVADRSLSLDLFAAEPPTTFGPESWFQGNWTVADTRQGVEHGIDAVGRVEDQVTSMTAFVTVPF